MPPAQGLPASTMSHLTRWRCNSTERRWRQSQRPRWCRAPSTTRFTIRTLSESYKIINAQGAWACGWRQSNRRRRHQDRRYRHRYRRDTSLLRSYWLQLSPGFSKVRCGGQRFASRGSGLQLRLAESDSGESVLIIRTTSKTSTPKLSRTTGHTPPGSRPE